MEETMGSTEAIRRGGHETAVLQAMTGPERILTLGILVFNLSLGGWLISRADFSAMRSGLVPPAASSAMAAEAPQPFAEAPIAEPTRVDAIVAIQTP